MNNNEIKLLKENAKLFPPLLKETPHTPAEIYIKGNEEVLSNKAISIVGTRKTTPLGLKIAEDFAYACSKAGFTIVSGLAMGIDSSAHKGALRAGGETIAVLGMGIDRIYPAQNEGLANEIIKTGGAIVSEYKPGAPSYKGNFIARNRIISGLSLATIVVEAPKRSGALSTAGFAGEQGREVFVIPGPINSPNYMGSHELIRDGAILVTSPEEILGDLGVTSRVNNRVNNYDKDTTIVLNAIEKIGGEVTVDELIEKTEIDTNKIVSILGVLSIEQTILETPTGYILA